MPEYLHPGVYVSEISSGSHVIQAASTSTACFMGEAVMGRPFAPTLVTSFSEFERTFGGIVRRSGQTQRDMPLAVQHFFLNGGTGAYIVRTIDPSDKSVHSTGKLGKLIPINAKGRGIWGDSIRLTLVQSKVFEGRATLLVYQQGSDPTKDPALVEQYPAIGFDPEQDKFYADIINRDSELIEVTPNTTAGQPRYWEGKLSQLGLEAPDETSQPETTAALSGGSDGVAELALSQDAFEAAMTSIEDNDEISILATPGILDLGIISYVIGAIDNDKRRDMIYIVDGSGDQHNAIEGGYDAVQRMREGISPKSSYAALYWPWLEVPDPYTSLPRATRFAPPSGFIAGLYAKTDNERGVHKAPAGTAGGLAGAVGLAQSISDAEQDLLNPVGINAIRQFADAGIVCWGTRTLSVDTQPEYMYVPIRRLAIMLRKSLYAGTQWAVFEPYDEPLWASLRSNIEAFLSIQFRAGAFQGSKPEDAYFVVCDKTNNPQASIDAGQINVLVGYCPLKPAEFVIIKLQQIRKDS